MNDEQLVDNLLTFYLAGHETTAKALTWTLYLLARSPRMASALSRRSSASRAAGRSRPQHIDEAGADAAGHQGIDAPVPAGADDDAAMRGQATALGGMRSRAGSSIVMPIYAIHRHAKRWDDADAFDPDALRAGAARRQIPRYQYMPFGAGSAHLHRHGLRHDRGHRDAGDVAAPRALRLPAWQPPARAHLTGDASPSRRTASPGDAPLSLPSIALVGAAGLR